MKRLLTYAETKHIFGWKNTSSVRRYVHSGDLERVRLGNGMNTYRITEESALAFIERLKSKYEQESYAERAAKHTARMRKALPEPEPEVMLDSEEIIRQSRLTGPEPQPRHTLDDALANRDAVQGQLPRPSRSDWGTHGENCKERESTCFRFGHNARKRKTKTRSLARQKNSEMRSLASSQPQSADAAELSSFFS